MEKNIEVEIRSFISKEKYNYLLNFFKNLNTSFSEDYQETYYLDSKEDLRICKTNDNAILLLKKGKIHDSFREEIEIKLNKEEFYNLNKIFSLLGFKIKVKFYRKRSQFKLGEVKVCLDYTKGYGYIIELEKMSSKSNKEKTLTILKEKLDELKIPLTPKEEFDEKFKYYMKNWEILIKE